MVSTRQRMHQYQVPVSYWNNDNNNVLVLLYSQCSPKVEAIGAGLMADQIIENRNSKFNDCNPIAMAEGELRACTASQQRHATFSYAWCATSMIFRPSCLYILVI